MWRKATLGGIRAAVGTIATWSHVWNMLLLAEAHIQEPDMGLYTHVIAHSIKPTPLSHQCSSQGQREHEYVNETMRPESVERYKG